MREAEEETGVGEEGEKRTAAEARVAWPHFSSGERSQRQFGERVRAELGASSARTALRLTNGTSAAGVNHLIKR